MNSIAINFVDCAIIVLLPYIYNMVGIAQRQEFRRRVLFSGRPHDAVVDRGSVAFRREHLQYDAHRPVGRRLPHRSGRVQLQPHRCRGDGVFATFLLPLYIRSGIFTIPEFLERRFDKRSRYYFPESASWATSFSMRPGRYAAALIIKLLFPEADLQLIIIIFAVLAASYTIPGGLSSAINAELIQAVILIVGSVILTGACFANGGFDYLASLFESGDMSVRLIRPLTDTATPWLGLIVGMPVLGIYFWANNQTLVQRVLSARSVDEGRKGGDVRRSADAGHPVHHRLSGRYRPPSLPGHRETRHDLSDDGAAPAAHGVTGDHAFSALLAALTSTLSAILNSTSTLFTMDFYAKIDKRADERKLVRVGKLASLVIIVIAAPLGSADRTFRFAAQILPGDASYIAPPVVAAFLMGVSRAAPTGGSL